MRTSLMDVSSALLPVKMGVSAKRDKKNKGCSLHILILRLSKSLAEWDFPLYLACSICFSLLIAEALAGIGQQI